MSYVYDGTNTKIETEGDIILIINLGSKAWQLKYAFISVSIKLDSMGWEKHFTI